MSEITRGAYTTFKYTYKTICPQHYTAYRPNSTFTVELQCIQANTGGTQTTKEVDFLTGTFSRLLDQSLKSMPDTKLVRM